MPGAYLNRIVTSVPGHDVHGKFVNFASSMIQDERSRLLFRRMADRAQIEHRYSVLRPHPEKDRLDNDEFYVAGAFPCTQKRMKLYERHALALACQAIDQLDPEQVRDCTHLLITTCTGFYAPGLDLQILQHYGLKPSVERTIIGFMGCYAAMNALKLARHILRSDQGARVLILNLELCTLHLQETQNIETILSFLLFADGCAAAIVSSEPAGLELESFHAAVIPDSNDQITWHIGQLGFDMVLSGRVPRTIMSGLPSRLDNVLDGKKREDVRQWAIHPGGRTVLDAVRDGAALTETELAASREVLRQYGNMSSAAIMFVLRDIMRGARGQGCAMAFGPGLTVESMMFQAGG